MINRFGHRKSGRSRDNLFTLSPASLLDRMEDSLQTDKTRKANSPSLEGARPISRSWCWIPHPVCSAHCKALKPSQSLNYPQHNGVILWRFWDFSLSFRIAALAGPRLLSDGLSDKLAFTVIVTFLPPIHLAASLWTEIPVSFSTIHLRASSTWWPIGLPLWIMQFEGGKKASRRT